MKRLENSGLYEKKTSIKWAIISEYRSVLLGIAALGIIVFHYFEDVLRYENGNQILYCLAKVYNGIVGSIGVEFFLFLSGMGLYYSLKKNSGIREFWIKRFSRVLIPYFVWATPFWIVKDVVIEKSGGGQFIKDLSLISFWLEGNRNLWFIAFIIIAYILMPYIYWIIEHPQKQWLLTINAIIYCIIIVIIKIFFKQFFVNTEIALLRVPIFVLGVCAGYKAYHNRNVTIAEAVFLMAGILIKIMYLLIWFLQIPIKNVFNNRLAIALFALALVVILSIVLGKCEESKGVKYSFFSRMGKYSLEIYLTHVTIRTIMNSLEVKTCFLRNYLICIILAAISAIVLKWIADKIRILLQIGKIMN